MTNDERKLLANLLGALALAVHDEVLAVTQAPETSESVRAALVQLLNYPGQCLEDLAAATGLSQSGTVRIMDRLERAKLAERTRAERDQRQVILHLTAEGSRLARRISAQRMGALETMVGILEPADQAALLRIATKLLAGHTRDLQHAYKTCRLCEESICTPDICPVEGSLRS